MARKKLTAKQRKARKRKQYIRYEYNLTLDALEYLNQLGAAVKVKIASSPTMRSLKAIRNLYNKTKKELQKKNWVIPSKRELAKAVREEQPYRRSRGQSETYEEAPPSFQPDTDYIEEISEKVRSLEGKERAKTTQHNEDYNKARLEQAKNRFFDELAFARAKVSDDTALAEQLAQSSFVERVDELSLKYDYEIVDGIDDTIIPLLMSAVQDTLDSFIS